MKKLSNGLPLGVDPVSRFLTLKVGLLVLLATLSLAVGMVMSSAAESLQRSLSGTLTVQVPAGLEQQSATESIMEILRATPNIRDVREIPDREINEALEPWLGAQAPILDLPLPALVDVAIESGQTVDIQVLTKKLSAVAPGTVVEEHSMWLGRLIDITNTVETVSMSVMLLVLISVVITVVFSTRTWMAVNREAVEVLHLIGAHDSYIAHQFQKHTFWLSSVGAAGGFALGTSFVLLIQFYIGRLSDSFLLDLTLGDIQWAALCLLPATAIIIVIATVGFTVKSVMRSFM